jgi:hypothetical protein
MQPVRLSRSIVAVAALSLLCSRPVLTQDSTGGSDPTGRGHSGQNAGGPGQGGPGGQGLADANWGNAVMTLLSIDPAVIDEGDPAKLDEDLNLFSRKNGFNAGGNSNYGPEFIKTWQSAVRHRASSAISSLAPYFARRARRSAKNAITAGSFMKS